MLTISGDFFDETITGDTKVLVGGEECVWDSATMTEIVCKAPELPLNSKFMGNRGVFVESSGNSGSVTLENVFEESGFLTVSDYDANSGFVYSQSEPEMATRMSGFLKINYAGRYQFGIEGAESMVLMVDGNEVVLSENGENGMIWSEYIVLEGDQHLLVQAGFINSVSSEVSVSTRFLDTQFLPGQLSNSNQKVDVSVHQYHVKADHLPEQQKITLNNIHKLSQVKNTNKDPKITSVCLRCITSLQNQGLCPGYQVMHLGYKTEVIQFGADSDDFEVFLNKLPHYSGSKVSYENETTNGNNCVHEYVIETKSAVTGDLTFKLDTELTGTSTIVMISVKNAGTYAPRTLIPTLSGLSLNQEIENLDQISTARLSFQTNLNDLTSSYCPTDLEKWGLEGKVFKWDAFEANHYDREEAFCGKSSKKNAGTVYYDAEGAGFNAVFEQNLCFAHKGNIQGLILKYSYRDGDNVARERTDTFRDLLELAVADGQWHWKCVNMVDLIESKVGNLVTSQRIITVRFTRDESDSDYWVDNLMISRQVSGDEDIANWANQRVESLAPKTEAVAVTVDGDNALLAEFGPINCANGYELISFVGMDEVTGSENTGRFYEKVRHKV